MDSEASCTGNNIVFIVGCPRSGTSWLQSMIAANPKIKTGPETHLFSNYISPQLNSWRSEIKLMGSPQGTNGLASYFEEGEFLSALREYLANLLKPMTQDLKPGELFVEKTPGHATALSDITLLLPESKIIHLIRDARDVVASLLQANKTWAKGRFTGDARIASSLWVKHVTKARRASKHLGSNQYLELKYEDLWNQPTKYLGEAWRFLGIDGSENEVANAIEANRASTLRESGGYRYPTRGEHARMRGGTIQSPPGFIRRAEPGGWRQDLTWVQKIQVWRTARVTMEEIGYPWKLPW